MYFIVLRNNEIPRAQWAPETLAAHLAWAKESFESGALRMSGPADEGRGGAYIIEAETVEAARAILDRDPINVNGCCTYSLVEDRKSTRLNSSH